MNRYKADQRDAHCADVHGGAGRSAIGMNRTASRSGAALSPRFVRAARCRADGPAAGIGCCHIRFATETISRRVSAFTFLTQSAVSLASARCTRNGVSGCGSPGTTRRPRASA